MRWVLAAVLAAWAGGAAAQDETPAKPGEGGARPARLVNQAYPGPADNARYFPKGVPASGLVGFRCVLTAEGRPSDCALVREEPKGAGLVDVARKEIMDLVRFKPVDMDGKPVAGRTVFLSQSYLAAGDKDNDWLQKPTADNMRSVYPVKAAQAGKDGSATISCKVTVEGYLDRCEVVSETPEGLGFGEGALALAPQFRMTPRIRGGKPVEGEVRIPVNWKGLTWMGGYKLESRLLLEPNWAKTPTAAQVAAAYPAKAAAETSGQATVRCVVNSSNALTWCEIASEIPANRGFGGAALRLSSNFRLIPAAAGQEPLKSKQVDLLFRFRNPTAPDDGRLTDVRWTETLSAAGADNLFPQAARTAGLSTGLGAVDCAATLDGHLTDCRVARQDPADKGFGEAALEAAKLLKMNPWTKGGDAVDGRRLTVPIRFRLDGAPTVEAEAKP